MHACFGLSKVYLLLHGTQPQGVFLLTVVSTQLIQLKNKFPLDMTTGQPDINSSP